MKAAVPILRIALCPGEVEIRIRQYGVCGKFEEEEVKKYITVPCREEAGVTRAGV